MMVPTIKTNKHFFHYSLCTKLTDGFFFLNYIHMITTLATYLSHYMPQFQHHRQLHNTDSTSAMCFGLGNCYAAVVIAEYRIIRRYDWFVEVLSDAIALRRTI